MKLIMRGWYRLNPIVGGIVLCVFLVIAFRYFYLQAVVPPAGLLVIDDINFTPTSVTTTASSSTNQENKPVAVQQRTLPDDWLRTSPDTSSGYYQTSIYIDSAPTGLWAIYLPVAQMSALIYINDIFIGQIGEPGLLNPHDDPFVRAAYQPYYFTLPDNVLKRGSNTLRLQVHAGNGSGLLDKIYLAEDKVLRPVFDKRFEATIISKQIITAGMLAIAILMTVLWLLRRQDQVYGWYALMHYSVPCAHVSNHNWNPVA